MMDKYIQGDSVVVEHIYIYIYICVFAWKILEHNDREPCCSSYCATLRFPRPVVVPVTYVKAW